MFHQRLRLTDIRGYSIFFEWAASHTYCQLGGFLVNYFDVILVSQKRSCISPLSVLSAKRAEAVYNGTETSRPKGRGSRERSPERRRGSRERSPQGRRSNRSPSRSAPAKVPTKTILSGGYKRGRSEEDSRSCHRESKRHPRSSHSNKVYYFIERNATSP